MRKQTSFSPGLNGMETKKRNAQLVREVQCGLDEEALNARNALPQLVHKLNNCLASVIGYAQLSLNRTTDPELQKQLGEIIKEAQKASQIIRDHVSLMKQEKPIREIQDINVLIEAVLEKKITGLNSKNINVVRKLSPSLPLTYLDPKQIQQVFLNLINNAEKAISESGGFGEIQITTRKIEDRVEIMISHNGRGTQETVAGQELGISYDILSEHGGTMRQESEWGRGATFIVTLPITVLERKKRENGERVKKDLKGMKGLVIDDDTNIVNMTSTFLEELGCEISTATDMKIAISLLEALGSIEEFDFIICDIKMPEMSGIDFYNIVQKKWPILKDRIIFSTGDILGDQTGMFINSVPNPCLEKPFNLTDLKEAINKL
jgi:CheY-like chemotaxis protein